MIEIGYKVHYFEKNRWQQLFVAGNNKPDIDKFIHSSQISKISRSARFKQSKIDINTQIILLNKLKGYIVSGVATSDIFKQILTDLPQFKSDILNFNIKISDFLSLCKFNADVVNIVRSAELAGAIGAGLDAAYNYINTKKQQEKGIKTTFKQNAIVLIFTISGLLIAPSFFITTLLNIQASVNIKTNFATDILFFIANYNYIFFIVLTASFIFIAIYKDKIKQVLAQIKIIDKIQDYFKSKDAINFLIVFSLLYKEGLDFLKIFNTINQNTNKQTTILIAQKLAQGISLSQAIKESDYPSWFRQAFAGFEKNTDKKVQLEILEKLIEVAIDDVNNKNELIISMIGGVIQLLILATIALIVIGYMLPIMSATSNLL